jgi:hypothetical protein
MGSGADCNNLHHTSGHLSRSQPKRPGSPACGHGVHDESLLRTQGMHAPRVGSSEAGNARLALLIDFEG